ncbi:hypothetical protein [Antarctobacter jejuensis]|uniref:hypothetical protein n=1 Tax=Antarctobacter jejuensis TaxID=1439938 RepID=UPI003FD48637
MEIMTMTDLFPSTGPTPIVSSHAQTMEDVLDHIDTNGPAYLRQALTTLVRHMHGTPLCALPADLAWIEEHFPRVKNGRHPRPDLGQKLEPYKKWRADLRRSVEIATGLRARKAALRDQVDGWAELLAAAKTHTVEGGLVHAAALSALLKLADLARSAEIDPWELANEDAIDRLENALNVPQDRDTIRRGQRFLNDYRFIPELAALLPKSLVPVLPTRRDLQALPDHVEAFLAQLVDRASLERDDVAGEDSQIVTERTRQHYLSALRHHLRALPHCPADPTRDYLPITDLTQVNDLAGLFDYEHLAATLRRTDALEHLPGTLSQASAYDYYAEIMVVLGRNELLPRDTAQKLKNSKFLKDGKELSTGMTQANKAWCKSLLADLAKERTFWNMHRIFQTKAQDILDAARAEGRDLTGTERIRVRQLGTCAAAVAIEVAGRPIRMANVLSQRLRGSRKNFATPSKNHPGYSFWMPAEEMKNGEEAEPTTLNKALYGPQVIAWYLKVIRPLFFADEKAEALNIHLFPGIQTAGTHLDRGTFDRWFQRAASETKLPMTFHNWRHGYATLLLDQDWSNLQLAADMLGNTPAVCQRNYAWLNKRKIFEEGQKRAVARARAKR